MCSCEEVRFLKLFYTVLTQKSYSLAFSFTARFICLQSAAYMNLFLVVLFSAAQGKSAPEGKCLRAAHFPYIISTFLWFGFVFSVSHQLVKGK